MKLKAVSGIMLTLLLIGTLTLAFNIQLAKASQPATTVYVHPSINYATLGQTFSINVSIANVTNLGGFELKLGYDTAILDIVKVSIPPFLNEPTWLVKNQIYEDEGWYWVAIGPWGPVPGKNGSGTLVTLTFKVTGIGSCVLDLYNTKLAAPGAKIIDHVVEDGYFEFTLREHDIAVSLDAQRHLMPRDSILLNATVFNSGSNNETDVELQLLINDSVVDSAVIDFLQANSSHTLSYHWTPPVVEATYNVTAYALPVSNEDFTLNNMKSAKVLVSYVIRVPFHYSTIQEAIDAASPGGTILVSAGTYYELLTIDKLLTLVGEESSSTIIDGSGAEVVIRVKADNVDISKFTIQNAVRIGILVDFGIRYTTITNNRIASTGNTGIALQPESCNSIISGNIVSNSEDSSIVIFQSDSNIVSGNILSNNGVRGVGLVYSRYNTIQDNIIINNTHSGIYLFCLSSNTIIGNTVSNNRIGIYANHTGNNVIYHNKFIKNTEQTILFDSSEIWDNGSEGNYWSDYNGTDSDGDGIGDNLYIINENNRDRYPIMNLYTHVDLNDDGAVDIYDTILIAVAYGSYPGHPRWDLITDINKDFIVNIFDAILLAGNFGKTF